MAEKTKTSRSKIPTGGHTPVSNQPEEEAEFFVEKPITEAPMEGDSPHTGDINEDGTEAINRPRGRGFAEISELIKAPDTSKLRDIGVASFGEPPSRLETVHGPDDRVKISKTNNYPWRVHASLLITAADNSLWIGTGWFIGPHTLATAGHVVYIKGSGVPGRDGWVKSIDVMPGRNGDKLPYGSVKSTSFRTVKGWTENGDENYDYGAIVIPTDLGKTVGWFGFGVYSDDDLLEVAGNISGYPGDQPEGTQWYDSQKIASVNSRKVYYDIDTYGGQSGSAVYRIKDKKRYGVAIHAYGGAATNSGTRIVTPVYDNLVNWKK